ncbi:MAG: GNAT family N-acetyltransferase [Anaerolineae bacterium]|nr:GNAT family N-acetyltransferase [Gemmatimonadaceae bacterium]
MTPESVISIRPAKPADRSWILPIAPRLHHFGPPPWRPLPVMDEAVTAAIDHVLVAQPSGSTVLVAEDDAGRPLGFIHVETHKDYFTKEEHGHVSDLVVASTAEHRGVGRALMTAAEDWARGLGFRLLTLNVFDGNHGARKLYDRLGYQPDTLKMVKVIG